MESINRRGFGRQFAGLAATTLTAPLVLAQAGDTQAGDTNKEIERLYEEWMTAATVHDNDWYKNNLADEFLYFSAGGGKATRDEIIAIANLSGNSAYKLYEVSSRQYGDVVLSHGRYMGKGDFPADDPLVSQAMREKYGRGVELRFTGTWIKRDGRWQSLHLQTCEIG